MMPALLPATAAPQSAEVARPGSRPDAANPRGEDAFAARLARAQSDAQPQIEGPAPAAAAVACEPTAPSAEAPAAEADEATGVAAELLAVIAFVPAAVAALAAPFTATAISTIEAAAGVAAAAGNAKPSAGRALDGAAHRAGPEVAAAGPTGPPPPAAPGVLPKQASEVAAALLEHAHADAAVRDEAQITLQAAPAGIDMAMAGTASAQPSTAAAAPAVPTPLATAHAAPPGLHIAAAVDTPAFAPALAHQVGWLVREGVGLASLHLNPPELGPVSVQIVVEGRQARVDFGAEMALTRSAIEDSLPRLAAAMQEIGLTLSGGGVFDGRQRRDAPAPLAEHDTATVGAARAAGRAGAADKVRQAPRGLVDLVA